MKTHTLVIDNNHIIQKIVVAPLFYGP